ncbi:histidine phosphatase family protein [Luteococcus sp. Sow4_B9]|uniref:histidine phosphatase family protein n=1 Tax=Luteococcus sp. Sow4_B9 TaxID=3438792 RepID=UPI003F978633
MQPRKVDLVLVRHGQSTWNLEGRLQGQTMDVPLTLLGQDQARTAAQTVAGLVPRGSLVLSSDQVRARQTAEVIGQALSSPVQTTSLLREQALGSLEGKLTAELRPEPVPHGADISEVRWGGGESVRMVHGRCLELLELLRQEGMDRAVLVGHGDALQILLAVLDGRGHRDVAWGAIGNGQVIRRSWQPG